MSASRSTSDNAAFDAHFIAELRSRVSLISLVGRDTKLERRGRLACRMLSVPWREVAKLHDL